MFLHKISFWISSMKYLIKKNFEFQVISDIKLAKENLKINSSKIKSYFIKNVFDKNCIYFIKKKIEIVPSYDI